MRRLPFILAFFLAVPASPLRADRFGVELGVFTLAPEIDPQVCLGIDF